MPDGIFDDGLPDEIGNHRVQSLRRNVIGNSQSVLKTDSLNLEIAQELQFFLKSDFLGAGVIERQAEKIAQPRDHSVGQLRVVM